MARKLALLRGVNVGGRTLPMAELRALCGKLGWKNAETYIQSGNLVFDGSGEDRVLEEKLETAIEKTFGYKPAVVVRSGVEWNRYIADNPFPKEAEASPNWLLLFVPKQPPKVEAVEALAIRGEAGEEVRRAGDVLWLWYPKGVGTSKLSPGLIDKLIGSPATSRNYRTVLKLQDMLKA